MNDKAIEAAATAAMRAVHGERYHSLAELEPSVADEFRVMARAAIAAYEAAMWRPIGDVPDEWKDGRDFLALYAKANIVELIHCNGAGHAWRDQEGDDLVSRPTAVRPCPLPAAPESE